MIQDLPDPSKMLIPVNMAMFIYKESLVAKFGWETKEAQQ